MNWIGKALCLVGLHRRRRVTVIDRITLESMSETGRGLEVSGRVREKHTAMRCRRCGHEVRDDTP